jgi:hypothetical protein
MKFRSEGCADMVSEDNFGFRNFIIVIDSSRLNWFSNCLYQKVKKGIKTSARRGQQPHRDRERRLPGSPSFSRQHGHGSVAYRDQLGNVQYIYFSHFLGNFLACCFRCDAFDVIDLKLEITFKDSYEILIRFHLRY